MVVILPAWTNLPSLVTGVQPFSSSLLPPLLGPPLLLPKALFGASGAAADMIIGMLRGKPGWWFSIDKSEEKKSENLAKFFSARVVEDARGREP